MFHANIKGQHMLWSYMGLTYFMHLRSALHVSLLLSCNILGSQDCQTLPLEEDEEEGQEEKE